MSAISKLIAKDVRMLMKERTFLALSIFVLVIVAVSKVVIIGTVLLNSPSYLSSNNVRIGVSGDCVVNGVCLNLKDALKFLNEGILDGVVYIKNYNGKYYAKVYVRNDVRGTLALIKIKKELIKFENAVREREGIPVFKVQVYYKGHEVSVPSWMADVFRFTYLLLIPGLVLITSGISAGVAVDIVTEEFRRGTLDLLLTSPIEVWEIFFSKLAVSVLFGLGLTSLWIVLLKLNGIAVENVIQVILLTLTVILGMVSASMLVSAYLPDRERAHLALSMLFIGIFALFMVWSSSPAVLAGMTASGLSYQSRTFLYLASSVIFAVGAYKISLRKLSSGR